MTKPITKKPIPYEPYTATEQALRRGEVQNAVDAGKDLARECPAFAYDVPHWVATLDAYRDLADKRVVQAMNSGVEAGIVHAAQWLKAHGLAGAAEQMQRTINVPVLDNVGTEHCLLCDNTGTAKTSDGETMGCPVYNEPWHRRTKA